MEELMRVFTEGLGDDDEKHAENRRNSRIGQFRERFQRGFGRDPESMDIEVKALGSADPSDAWGEFTYKGESYRLELRIVERGKAWFVNDEYIAPYRGTKSNHATAIASLLNFLRKPELKQESRTEEEDTNGIYG